MVRPRSQQINNLQTRHSRLSYIPTPRAFRDTVPAATMHAATVSDVPMGSDQELTGTISSSAGPFATAAGDSWSVQVDSDPAVTVVLAATDTTASRIAAAVNAAMGGTYADASQGVLRVFTQTSGPDGQITLADVVPGSLAKLGIASGVSVAGSEPPVRGVLTSTPDGLGGTAPIKTSDGRDLVTDASAVYLVSEAVGPVTIRTLERPGGIPLHARVSWNPGTSEYELRYHARLPLRPTVETFNSRFDLLDGTDTITFTLEDGDSGLSPGSFTVTFPSGPALTRDQVVTRINELWADFANTGVNAGEGRAHVTGTISGPFTVDGSQAVAIVSVDGGAPQTWTLPTGTSDAATIASGFNGDITGATATVVTSGNKQFIRIESDNDDGTDSSIELLPPAGGQSDVFQQLGILPGLYRGYYIAQPSGNSEIRLFGFGRGANATLEVSSGNATTLTRMGLTAAVHTGAVEGDEPYAFPDMFQNDVSRAESVISLIPEVMDFGEVPFGVEAETVQFGRSGAGNNLLQSQKNIYLDEERPVGLGIADAGKAFLVGPDGSVLPTAFYSLRGEYENMFKQFIRGDFSDREVTHLVTPAIETPGTNGNPGVETNNIFIDVDPAGSFPVPLGSRNFFFRFERDGGSPYVPFGITEVEAASAVDGVVGFLNVGDGSGRLTAIRNANNPLLFRDANTDSAGVATSGVRTIPLSSSTSNEGDRTLRIMDLEEGNTEPVSIFRQINARATVTCGDGVNTFGDFNGADALSDAISFAAANSIQSIHILLKRGDYNANALAICPFVSSHVVIEGVTKGSAGATAGARIINTGGAAIDPALVATGTRSTVELRNLVIQQGSAGQIGLQATSCFLVLDRVDFQSQNINYIVDRDIVQNPGVGGPGNNVVHLKSCSITVNAGSGAPFVLTYNDAISTPNASGFLFEDCWVKILGFDIPAFQLVNDDIGVAAVADRIMFNRCRIELRTSATTTGNDLDGNCGAFEIVPGATTNLSLGDVTWKDCHVSANLDPSSGVNSVLLYLRTSDGTGTVAVTGTIKIEGGRWEISGSSTEVSPFYIGGETYIDEEVQRVVIRDVEWGPRSLATSVNQGAPTDEVSGPGQDFWGQFFINADEIVMEEVRWTSSVWAGGTPAFYGIANVWKVNGVYLTDWVDTGVVVANPQFQMRFQSRGDVRRSGTISNVVITAETAPTNLAGFSGIMNFMPFGRMDVRDCVISNFDNASTTAMRAEAGAGDTSDGLFIHGCRIVGVGGFGFFHEGTPSSGGLAELSICQCEFKNMGTDGIRITSSAGGPAPEHVSIIGNQFSDNTGRGIFLRPESSPAIGQPHVLMNDNTFRNNFGAGSNVQVYYDGSIFSVEELTFMGNAAGSSGSGNGKFRSEGSPSFFAARGLETGISGTGNYDAISTYTDQGRMLQNRMELEFV